MHNLEEKKLVEKAKTEPEAWGILFDQNYDRIFRYICKRTCDFELSKDLTSETFFKALKNLPKYQSSGAPFSAWLYKIAISQISDHYRAQKKYFQTTLEECPELIGSKNHEPDTQYLEKEKTQEEQRLMGIILKHLKSLKPIYQDIITLQYYEEKTMEEISEILKKPVGTIKSYRHRAIKKLQELVTT